MIVRLGPVVSAAAGSIGGVTFQRDPGGTILRSRPLPTLRRTIRTNTERQGWQYLSRRWAQLTQVQRDAWQTQADLLTWSNRFGDPVRGLGYWLYLRCNGYRILNGAAVVDAAGAVAPLTALGSPTATLTVATGILNVAWSVGAVPAAETWLYQATAPQSAGRSNPVGRFRQVGRFSAGQTSPQPVQVPYTARFGGLPAATQKAWFEMIPIITSWGLPGARVRMPLTIV